MTSFTDEVYKIIAKIPKSKVATYSQIAKKLNNPRAVRTVGNILHKNPNPENFPCHRVVNTQGKLAKNFAFGGINGQKDLLEKEGIKVNADFKVDLGEYLWK